MQSDQFTEYDVFLYYRGTLYYDVAVCSNASRLETMARYKTADALQPAKDPKTLGCEVHIPYIRKFWPGLGLNLAKLRETSFVFKTWRFLNLTIREFRTDRVRYRVKAPPAL